MVIHLVELDLRATTEGGTETYQVPLAFYEHPETRLDHAFVGWWEDAEHGWVHAYDALHDREAMALLAAGLRRGRQPGRHRRERAGFHRLPGHDLDLEAHSTLFAGEQSNSSVAFGEDALLKVFRKITPGANPDITVHEVLTEAESEHIAALYGWLEVDGPGGPGRRASSSSRCSRSSCARPPTAGSWRWPASGRCSPSADAATRVRSPAATSPARRPGSARRCGRCTTLLRDALPDRDPAGRGGRRAGRAR